MDHESVAGPTTNRGGQASTSRSFAYFRIWTSLWFEYCWPLHVEPGLAPCPRALSSQYYSIIAAILSGKCGLSTICCANRVPKLFPVAAQPDIVRAAQKVQYKLYEAPDMVP